MKKKLLSDKLHIFWICIVGISSYLTKRFFGFACCLGNGKYCAVSLLPNIPIMVNGYKLRKAYNERSLQNVVGEDDLPKNNGL